MPHIHLETTADLPENAQVPDILEALTARLAEFDSVDSAAIKSYHSLRSIWHMGEGAPSGFGHCTVSILAGRNEVVRRQIADALFRVMREQFAESLEADEVGVTVDIREMDAVTYRK